MKKIGIIGHFGGNNYFTDGQTVKTKEVYNYLVRDKYTVIKYDTYNIMHHPFRIIMFCISALKTNDVIIFMLSTRGYPIILPLLVFFNKYYKKQVYDFVIGGDRQNVLAKNRILYNCNKKLNKIYVETDSMVKAYKKLGLTNVEKLINFKNIKIQELDIFKQKDKLKVCTFSRICKEKGIEESIEAVKLTNKKLKKNAIELVIYGIPDSGYVERFEEIKKDFSSYITYGGLIDPSKSSATLKDYDMLLFQTFWKTEGMPGTIIDASCAGLPTIATDWNCNKELVIDNKNGRIVKVHDVNEVSELLVYYYKNQKELYSMKKQCLKVAKDFSPDGAMKKFIEQIGD